MTRQEIEPCNQCGCMHSSRCRYGTQECYGCGATDHKIANCPKKLWNRQSNTQVSGTGNNPVSQGGRPPTNATLGRNRGGKRPQIGGRVFSLRGEEARDPTIAVSGILLIKHLYTHVLFDSGATYSYKSYLCKVTCQQT